MIAVFGFGLGLVVRGRGARVAAENSVRVEGDYGRRESDAGSHTVSMHSHLLGESKVARRLPGARLAYRKLPA